MRRGSIALAVVALAGALAHAGSGNTPPPKTPCQPRWFVPSLEYSIRKTTVHIDASFTYLARNGLAGCHIPSSSPFDGELFVIGRGGIDVVHPDDFSWSGDEYPNAGGGTAVDIPLRAWCRQQPVDLKLIGGGPNYSVLNRGYKLALPNVTIRCS